MEIKSEHNWNRYQKFIKACRSKEPSPGVYCEIHHIIPKSHGGSDDRSNLVKLEARQHYIAHWLLMNALQTSEMYNAFQLMCQCEGRGQMRRYRVNSKAYARATDHQSKVHSLRMTGDGNPRFGVKLSEEFKLELGDKISQATKGKPKSEDFKRMMAEKYKGRHIPEEWKEKMRKPKALTEEQRKHCADRLLAIPKKICPECGAEVASANYARHRKARHGIS